MYICIFVLIIILYIVFVYMADRPIKYNPKGQYNLNFIDWQN
jgi:hypothetical protein